MKVFPIVTSNGTVFRLKIVDLSRNFHPDCSSLHMPYVVERISDTFDTSEDAYQHAINMINDNSDWELDTEESWEHFNQDLSIVKG